MPPVITPERPNTDAARALIAELEAALNPHYPPESRHGYSVEKLIRDRVAFFVIRVGDTPPHPPHPAGCGGIQLFGNDYGELKRMYTRPAFRGQGLGQLMIDHLAAHARAHNVSLLRLETGIHQHEAIRLYERAGFTRIGPFGPYRDDPLSLFFERNA